MIAYRLQPLREIENEQVSEYMYDIDDAFRSKESYIKCAKKWTLRVNAKFNTNYKWTDLFSKPTNISYRYCTRCHCYYWLGEECFCCGN